MQGYYIKASAQSTLPYQGTFPLITLQCLCNNLMNCLITKKHTAASVTNKTRHEHETCCEHKNNLMPLDYIASLFEDDKAHMKFAAH